MIELLSEVLKAQSSLYILLQGMHVNACLHFLHSFIICLVYFAYKVSEKLLIYYGSRRQSHKAGSVMCRDM